MSKKTEPFDGLTEADHVTPLLRLPGARLTGLPVGETFTTELAAARVEVPVHPAIAAMATMGLDARRKDGSRSVYAWTGARSVPEPGGSMPDLDDEAERVWGGVVAVDRPLAEAWLARNTRNRPLTRTVVKRYRDLIGTPRWLLTTDAVGFDRLGRLSNAQHRLTALVEYFEAEPEAEPVPMLVVTGLEPEAFAVLDGGKQRTAADALAIEGFKYCSVIASVVRHVGYAERGRLWRQSGNIRLEADEVLRRAKAEKEELETCARIAGRIQMAGRSKGAVMRVRHTAFVLYAYRKTGAGEAVESYLESVATGTGGDRAAGLVRGAFLDNQEADVRMGAPEAMAVLLRGAQHVALGREMKRARGKGAGFWPSPAVPGWPRQTRPGDDTTDASGDGHHEPAVLAA